MSRHLSQDQLSLLLLGRSTPEEREHASACPHCSAELARFQKPVTAFRTAWQDWSGRSPIPLLRDVSRVQQSRRSSLKPSWSWAAVVMALVMITAVPIYRLEEELLGTQKTPRVTIVFEDIPAGDVSEEALLMNAVELHLSRPFPAPMEPILSLLPNPELNTNSGEMQ